jgi:hypothetical protein
MIAGQILGEENQVKIRLLARSAGCPILSIAACDVGFAADDGLYTLVLHRVVKRDSAKHIAVVGHGAGGHSKFFKAFCQGLDLNGAVKQAVVSVEMQMYELFIRHVLSQPERSVRKLMKFSGALAIYHDPLALAAYAQAECV